MAKTSNKKDAAMTVHLNEGDLEKMKALAEATAPRVTSAKLKDLGCHYSYNERLANGYSNNILVKSDALIHPDLAKAFNNFNGHLAVVCEEVLPKEVESIEECTGTKVSTTEKLAVFTVQEVVIDGNFEDGSVILKGEKLLSTNESARLETPKVKWSAKYDFLNELRMAVEILIEEVLAYHSGKIQPDPQGDLFEQNN